MKNYDLNIRSGIHTVKITLQRGRYFGHIIEDIHGNCKGLDIIHFFDFEEEAEDCRNDCNLFYDSECEEYSAVLTDEDGNKVEFRSDAEDFNNMIVKIEILDFRKDENT